jgi:hypothetical protein
MASQERIIQYTRYGAKAQDMWPLGSLEESIKHFVNMRSRSVERMAITQSQCHLWASYFRNVFLASGW